MTDQPQTANQTPDQTPARDAPQDAGQASAASTPAPDAPKADAPKAAAPERVELSAEINAEIEAAISGSQGRITEIELAILQVETGRREEAIAELREDTVRQVARVLCDEENANAF